MKIADVIRVFVQAVLLTVLPRATWKLVVDARKRTYLRANNLNRIEIVRTVSDPDL